MAAKRGKGKAPATTGRGLRRLTIYLHGDEMSAVEELARKARCSKADAIRRAVRSYFKIED